MDVTTGQIIRQLKGHGQTFTTEDLEDLIYAADEVLLGRKFSDFPEGQYDITSKKLVRVDENGQVTITYERGDRGMALLGDCFDNEKAEKERERLAQQARLVDVPAETHDERIARLRSELNNAALNLDGAPSLEAVVNAARRR